MEKCRSCNTPYAEGGDGFDGECPTCADHTELVRLIQVKKASPEARAAVRKCLVAQLGLFDAARELEMALEGEEGEIDGIRDLVEQACAGLQGPEDINEQVIAALLDLALPTPVVTGGILATFVPQAWMRDNLLTVEPQGPTEFDVTEAVLAMGREAALALRDEYGDTDEFQKYAPMWARNWSGPFRIEIADSIQDYFDRQDEQEAQ